jgi:hypothetical protein
MKREKKKKEVEQESIFTEMAQRLRWKLGCVKE